VKEDEGGWAGAGEALKPAFSSTAGADPLATNTPPTMHDNIDDMLAYTACASAKKKAWVACQRALTENG
jgi:hypothetical protein